jgi:hypothetical protein
VGGIEAVIAIEDREEVGSSSCRSSMMSSNGLLLMSPSASRSAVVASTPVRPGSAQPKLQGMMSLTEGWNGLAFPTPATLVGTFFSVGEPRYEDFGMVTEYDDASPMDTAKVDEMLKRSVKPSTMSKYSRLLDKWVAFADYHEVETMPPDSRGQEIFIADSAKLSGSAGIANSTQAAVAHFISLEGYESPFFSPRFLKILRGMKAAFGRATRPKKPFLCEHIVSFMRHARGGSLLDWRAALPLALCYQQLLRGAECFELNGSKVVRHPNFFMVEVDSSKNISDGFSFKLHIEPERPHCVGMFLADYVARMGVILGDKDSFFACKIGQTKGVLSAVPLLKVTNSTMRSACKKLIKAVGMSLTDYALHSCKRGRPWLRWRLAFLRCRSRIWDVGLAWQWSSGTLARTPRCGRPWLTSSRFRSGMSSSSGGQWHNGIVLRLGFSRRCLDWLFVRSTFEQYYWSIHVFFSLSTAFGIGRDFLWFISGFLIEYR